MHRVGLLAGLAGEELAQAAHAHAVASIGGANAKVLTAQPIEESPTGHSLEALRPLDPATHIKEEDDLEQA